MQQSSAVSTGTDIFNAHFAHSAIGAVITLAAATSKAHLTVAAQLIVRAVFTLLAAFRTDYGTFRAALTTSDADVINAEFAKITVQTVAAVSAHTVIAGSAILADTAVGALLALFFALFADQDTLATAPAAFTYVFRTEFTQQAFRAVVALAAETVKAGSAVGTKLIFCTVQALFIALFAAGGAFRAALAAVADPVRTADAQHALGAVQLVTRTFGADAAVVADEIDALRTVLVAQVADVPARRIAAAAFFVALAAFVETVPAVVAQLVVIVTRAAVAAMMLLVAGRARAFTAVIAVIAFPVVIPPTTAMLAFYTILVGGIYRHRKE